MTFMILFSMLILFASQPAEYGTLIFANKNDDVTARFLKGRSFGNNRSLGSAPLRIVKQKGVCIVKNLLEFLFVYLRSTKDLFVKLSFDHNQGLVEFQNVAMDIGEKAVFISIETKKKSPIVQLFKLLLDVKKEVDEPLFFLCKRGFVQMPKIGVLSFNKACLQILHSESGTCITSKQVLSYIDEIMKQGKDTKDSLWNKVKRLFQ
jgi:hypothetical protein